MPHVFLVLFHGIVRIYVHTMLVSCGLNKRDLVIKEQISKGVSVSYSFQSLNPLSPPSPPVCLTLKVAPEEFYATIQRVNSIVQKQVPLGFKCFLLGCFCCCCTAGLSLGPAMILNKRVSAVCLSVCLCVLVCLCV